MTISGNYGDTENILAEFTRPGFWSKTQEKALVRSSALYAMIAGEYKGGMNKSVVPKMREESAVGSGYFENVIIFKENPNISFRSKTDPLPTTQLDLGDRPKVPVVHLVGTVPLYLADLDLNMANPDRQADLSKLAAKQAILTANNIMGVAVFDDGTGWGSKGPWGLDYWFPDAVTTGSVAGISQATETNWRPYVLNSTSRSFATYAQADLETAFLETNFGEDRVDLVVMGNTNFGRLKAILTALNRYLPTANEKIRAAGCIDALDYSGRAVIADSNIGASATDNTPACAATAGDVYGLCTKKFNMLVVKGCSFVLGQFIEPVNEQYKAAKLTARFNFVPETRKPFFKEYGNTTA